MRLVACWGLVFLSFAAEAARPGLSKTCRNYLEGLAITIEPLNEAHIPEIEAIPDRKPESLWRRAFQEKGVIFGARDSEGKLFAILSATRRPGLTRIQRFQITGYESEDYVAKAMLEALKSSVPSTDTLQILLHELDSPGIKRMTALGFASAQVSEIQGSIPFQVFERLQQPLLDEGTDVDFRTLSKFRERRFAVTDSHFLFRRSNRTDWREMQAAMGFAEFDAYREETLKDDDDRKDIVAISNAQVVAFVSFRLYRNTIEIVALGGYHQGVEELWQGILDQARYTGVNHIIAKYGLTARPRMARFYNSKRFNNIQNGYAFCEVAKELH